nr:Transcriptional regulatory protein BasR [Candidatus Pantoea persica]
MLASTQSAPLHSLLHTMLKKSDNMPADMVFRTIGHHYFNAPGTFRAGSDAIRRILREKADIDLGNSIQVDGSGLSRHDLIAPDTMMQVLQYIAKNDATLDYISMLPLAGHDGTLHEAGVDGKYRRKPARCRASITWQALSPLPAARASPLCSFCRATPCRRRISARVAFRWCALKAAFTGISTRTTSI